MPEMNICEVGYNADNNQPLVLLKEQEAETFLLIEIGRDEAAAIAIGLEKVEVTRPMSHDLLCSVINSLKASVDHVLINDFKEGTFYSKIILSTAEGTSEIDSRPSDALALAVRTGVPIFAEESVIEKAGLLIQNENGAISVQEAPERKRVSQKELDGMSAFTDFIGNLDMDDLGSGK